MLVFAVKGALVPLQFWLPGTYANAPGPVAALFAVMTKVGAYAVIRFGTLVFPPESAATGSLIADLLTPAALATLALGAVGVLGAHSLPRQVAFAAIGSMGMLFLAVAAFTPAATSAALYYLAAFDLCHGGAVPDGRSCRRTAGRPGGAIGADRGAVHGGGGGHGRNAAAVGLCRQAAGDGCAARPRRSGRGAPS